MVPPLRAAYWLFKVLASCFRPKIFQYTRARKVPILNERKDYQIIRKGNQMGVKIFAFCRYKKLFVEQ